MPRGHCSSITLAGEGHDGQGEAAMRKTAAAASALLSPLPPSVGADLTEE